MSESRYEVVALPWVIVLVFVSIIVIAGLDLRCRGIAVRQFTLDLEKTGLTVLEGIIESPSVIIVVRDSGEFIAVIEENQQDTVYRYINKFYTFNDDMTIAWKFCPGGLFK